MISSFLEVLGFNRLLVQDNPKLLDDNGEVPKLNIVVGSSIPGCEIISILTKY